MKVGKNGKVTIKDDQGNSATLGNDLQIGQSGGCLEADVWQACLAAASCWLAFIHSSGSAPATPV